MTDLQQVQLPGDDAATYAHWFACLAEPVRVRLLHAAARTRATEAANDRGLASGELAAA